MRDRIVLHNLIAYGYNRSCLTTTLLLGTGAGRRQGRGAAAIDGGRLERLGACRRDATDSVLDPGQPVEAPTAEVAALLRRTQLPFETL